MIMNDDFENARWLVLSHSDAEVVDVLKLVRDVYPSEFDKMLVLAASIKDERFDRYGCADVLPIIRNLELTNDFGTDSERLLTLMRYADREATADSVASEIDRIADDPQRRVIEHALRKHGSGIAYALLEQELMFGVESK